jgi:hypothetical protein
MTCRTCSTDYIAARGSTDCRCGRCKAASRWWTREQIGTRAQVYVTSPDSAFHGETGIGERTRSPGDGWMVNLLSGGKPMFFGASAVSVDFEIRAVREPPKPFLLAPGRNGHPEKPRKALNAAILGG